MDEFLGDVVVDHNQNVQNNEYRDREEPLNDGMQEPAKDVSLANAFL